MTKELEKQFLHIETTINDNIDGAIWRKFEDYEKEKIQLHLKQNTYIKTNSDRYTKFILTLLKLSYSEFFLNYMTEDLKIKVNSNIVKNR